MRQWKDSDLKTLFREMRERDRQSATPFHHDWGLARSRMGARRKTSLKYAIAIASVAASALSAAIVMRIFHAPSPQTGRGSPEFSAGIHDQVEHPDPHPPITGLRPGPQPEEPNTGNRARGTERARYNSRARRAHRDAEAYQDQHLISKWRSPTDFLLESPGHDLLKAVPNIEDSLVRIDGR